MIVAKIINPEKIYLFYKGKYVIDIDPIKKKRRGQLYLIKMIDID